MDTKPGPCRRRYFLHGLIPQLLAFEACIRNGTVTAAARELLVAQPTVSCLVRKLGITFGAPLVTRRGGRMVPTPMGEKILVLSAEIIESLERFDARQRWRVEREAALRSAAHATMTRDAESSMAPFRAEELHRRPHDCGSQACGAKGA